MRNESKQQDSVIAHFAMNFSYGVCKIFQCNFCDVDKEVLPLYLKDKDKDKRCQLCKLRQCIDIHILLILSNPYLVLSWQICIVECLQGIIHF